MDKANTLDALSDPRPGDIYHEMYSFWVAVLYVDDACVIALTHSGHPSEMPTAGTVERWTCMDFVEHFSYTTIPGAWVRLDRRGDPDAAEWWSMISDQMDAGLRKLNDHVPPFVPAVEQVLWPKRARWPQPDPWRPPAADVIRRRRT